MARPFAEAPKFRLIRRGKTYYVRFWWRGCHWRVSTFEANQGPAQVAMDTFIQNWKPDDWVRKPRPPRILVHPKQLPALTATLKNKEAILGSAISAANVCGIYFLIREKQIIYVGQAVNVFSRVKEHVGAKSFDSWNWVPVPAGYLDIYERAYIDMLMPCENLDSRTKRLRIAMRDHVDF